MFEHVKILDLQKSNDLTWINHISETVKKVTMRQYFLC